MLESPIPNGLKSSDPRKKVKEGKSYQSITLSMPGMGNDYTTIILLCISFRFPFSLKT